MLTMSQASKPNATLKVLQASKPNIFEMQELQHLTYYD
jgi:hypothetical protein